MQALVNDISIHYEIDGPADAPSITLSHSLAANLQLWNLQLPVLRDRYRVLRFDTRGHGSSSAPPGASIRSKCWPPTRSGYSIGWASGGPISWESPWGG